MSAKIERIKNPIGVAMGKLGGTAMYKKYGREHMVEMSRKGKITMAKNRLSKIEGVKLKEKDPEEKSDFKLI